jgi:2-C-methyl-D-erythritol 4-phosphate cytidylyltransferase/2-C-methyl-D-erythritol 2,4-cyclodiphosphate synthase
MAGTVAAVVVAAGRGLRAGGGIPKQYRPIPGGTAIQRSLAMFSSHDEIAFVQPVIHPDDQDAFVRSSAEFRLLPAVFGGATRQDSVRS